MSRRYVNDEMGRMKKKSVMANFKVLSQHLSGSNDDDPRFGNEISRARRSAKQQTVTCDIRPAVLTHNFDGNVNGHVI
jgi:hypothetical protein